MIKLRNKLEYDLPADDPRTKLIKAKIKKEKNQPDALIQILHTAQNIYGYLPMNAIGFITKELKLPPSRVFGAVTFYHFFSLKPNGEHTCLVCTGTACYVKGAQGIMDKIQEQYGICDGEVTEDEQLGLQVARCLGACGLAPAVVIDDKVYPKVQAEDIQGLIEGKIGVKK
ncbi:MAG: NAD(P)H-dependent oxidoreductase subunit E [Candidatus Omnitrophica bacterium]|nr:NAD(P)H-dependent oxidoreductase subunit E [Candidatus Omnitrophota bacterium]